MSHASVWDGHNRKQQMKGEGCDSKVSGGFQEEWAVPCSLSCVCVCARACVCMCMRWGLEIGREMVSGTSEHLELGDGDGPYKALAFP